MLTKGWYNQHVTPIHLVLSLAVSIVNTLLMISVIVKIPVSANSDVTNTKAVTIYLVIPMGITLWLYCYSDNNAGIINNKPFIIKDTYRYIYDCKWMQQFRLIFTYNDRPTCRCRRHYESHGHVRGGTARDSARVRGQQAVRVRSASHRISGCEHQQVNNGAFMRLVARVSIMRWEEMMKRNERGSDVDHTAGPHLSLLTGRWASKTLETVPA